jgi:hypothetical protein
MEQQLAKWQAALKLAEEGLTVAYMSGFHDGKKKGGREALLEAAEIARNEYEAGDVLVELLSRLKELE